jgi:hypothetical protein
MDDVVVQALAKWPDVPHCYGWLGLDLRGHWHLRDAGAQVAGPFASGQPGAQGALLQHEKLIGFIHRNYACDEYGQWFFQNGPQRVYVELELTPWVWRVAEDFGILSHTGQPTLCSQCLMDEQGWVYLETPLGFGLVHSSDVGIAALAVESGRWSVNEVLRSDLQPRYHFVASPSNEPRMPSKI